MILTTALLALATAPPLQEYELLPDVPAGWRYERLELPLSFAPELEHEGMEELAFAPGMFDPDSDSYWSYALDVRVEEDVEVDAAWLTHFLDAYYRGLCRAVGASRDPVPDLSDFAVEVAFDGERFSATIEMVDAFVTGGPLTLSLKLDVQRGARTTELFGIASPLDEGAPIWKELEALRGRWLERRHAPVLLSCVSLIVDEETLTAITGSAPLRELFGARRTTVTEFPLFYTEGLWLAGTSTVLALHAASESVEAGASSIAFAVERPGGLARADALALGPEAARRPEVRLVTIEEGEGPWAAFLPLGEFGEAFQVVAFELDRRFLERWKPELPPDHGGTRRHDAMARYNASLGWEPEEPTSLVDMTDVHVLLPRSTAEELVGWLEPQGWVVEDTAGGLVCDGPGARLHVTLSEADGEPRLVGVDLLLREPVAREPLRLGRATLSFEGMTARLRVGS